MTAILTLDQFLFHLINETWQHPWLDALMPFWREKETWIPLYVGLAVFVGWKFRWQLIYFLLAIALTIGISDTVSSKVIKPAVERLRPCNDPVFKSEVELRIRCGPGFSFPSSHAANHFALAMFLFLTLGGSFMLFRWPVFLWAASIAYGQVYVGVHYPVDVVGGALLGLLIGWAVAKLYLRFARFSLRPKGVSEPINQPGQ